MYRKGYDNRGQVYSVKEIWPGYLQSGYFDEKNNLRVELVERGKVEMLAKQLASDRLTMHQLRRFFDHSRHLETLLKSGSYEWRQVEADFRKLDVAAADAAGKHTPKIPEIFHDFIRTNVGRVRTKDDFLRGFLPHFEALVGFCSGKLRERRT